MAYTTHGHQIEGTKIEDVKPEVVARCGGPGLCSKCSREAVAETAGLKSRKDIIMSMAAELIDASVKNGTFAGVHTVIGAFVEAERLLDTDIKVGDVIDDPDMGEAHVVYITQNGEVCLRFGVANAVPQFQYRSREFILNHRRK